MQDLISENDRIVKISDDLGNLGPKNPNRIMSNPPIIDQKIRQKPVCFSDLMSNRQSLVGTSNTVALDKPSVDAQVRKRNRRKVRRKKEEVSIDSSLRTIKEYFPLIENSDVESNGKRKLNVESNLESKRLKVGNQSI